MSHISVTVELLQLQLCFHRIVKCKYVFPPADVSYCPWIIEYCQVSGVLKVQKTYGMYHVLCCHTDLSVLYSTLNHLLLRKRLGHILHHVLPGFQ